MTSAKIFKKFPALWDLFEKQLKEKYLIWLSEGRLKVFDPDKKELSNIYNKVGRKFWYSDGSAEEWINAFDELFFENRHYNFKRNLYKFKEMDSTAQNSISNIIFKTPGRVWRLALKPILDTRKQMLLNELSIFKKELYEPKSLDLTWWTERNKYSYRLKFKSIRRVQNTGVGVDGYTYKLNGRTYKDVSSFNSNIVEELFEDVMIREDIYGEKLLRVYHSIPTFDSSDREGDSASIYYLIFDGKNINLINMRGGYKIASLTFYENLLSADSSMKPYFDKLGWKCDGIKWE